MSIFKVKQLWSNEKLQSEEHEEGMQNSCCVKVDKFNCYNDSDCILVAEGKQIKIYKPNVDSNDSEIVLETQISDVILQIDTGKFLFESNDRQILILHPQSYEIYLLEKREGHVDAGNQNYIKPMVKHTFTRKAYSVIVGPFGSSKSRDLICIQSLDGTISFFDQDAFLFMCVFDDIILPGPVSYISSSDLFVICKSTWVLEIYSYQQLAEFSELSNRQQKKHVPQWSYSPGEEISSVQVIRTSSNISSIIALGERYLYCFQDNGLMKYMIRFDFMPVCCHAYLIGWYYEPNSRLLVMVVSEDSKLHIFEETSMLWSCDLLDKTISVSRCFLKNLPGGLVTLSPNGIVNVSYLGTEPDLNSTIPTISAPVESGNFREELQTVEDALDKILNNDEPQTSDEDIIQIKIDFGKTVETWNEENSILNCPLVITLTSEDVKQVQDIQITFACVNPFRVSDPVIYLNDINGTEIVQTLIILSNDMDISSTIIKILFTITESSGLIIALSKNVLIPINVYAQVGTGYNEMQCKLYLQTNQKNNLDSIFLDLLPSNSNIVTFLYKNTKKSVTITSTPDHFVFEANDFTEIFPVLDFVLYKLYESHAQTGKDKFKASFNLTKELIKSIVHKFLKCIEEHAKERVDLKSFEEELQVLQSQFTLIQKKLLIQYGSLPPGNCDALEFLMRDTHESIIRNANRIIDSKTKVARAACELGAVGRLIICVMKCSEIEDLKIKILEETLSFETFDVDFQEWEETVTQASPYILNNILKKSEKDKEKLAPVTDQDILSNINLKRFIKQTKLILERMFLEAFDGSENDGNKEKVTRIEEFVEVI